MMEKMALMALMGLLQENGNVARADILVGEDRTFKQILIGKKRQATGVGTGNMRTIQKRCRYCSTCEHHDDLNGGTGAKRGAYRAAYTCSVHPGVVMCRHGKHACWADHLEEVEADRR